MYESYETQTISYKKAMAFIQFHTKNIGTEYELNKTADIGKYYILFVDLESNEVDKLRDYENKNKN